MKTLEEKKEYQREWQRANRMKSVAYSTAYRRANTDKVNAYRRLRYAADSSKIKENNRRWRQANSARMVARARAQEIAKLQRTPLWADLKKIEKVYEEARMMTLMMGEPWHVDHVIPLRGRKVSGLHVHGNLQLLPGVENMKKRNNFEVL